RGEVAERRGAGDVRRERRPGPAVAVERQQAVEAGAGERPRDAAGEDRELQARPFLVQGGASRSPCPVEAIGGRKPRLSASLTAFGAKPTRHRRSRDALLDGPRSGRHGDRLATKRPMTSIRSPSGSLRLPS